MKTFYTFLITVLCIAFCNTSSAQCDFPEGDFEVWTDVTSVFNEELPEGTIILPENSGSLIRLFTIFGSEGFLEGVFNMISDPTLYNKLILGIERSEDASSGQYSLKMGGDEMIRTTDILMLATCGEVPDSLFFDAKHFGATTIDTISLICFVGNTSGIPIDNEGNIEQANVNKFLTGNFVANGDAVAFQTLGIPFTEVNPNVAPDTIVFWLILDNQDPDMGEEYGCIVIDNFRFSRERNTTPTSEITFVDHTKVYPSLAKDFVNISSDNEMIKTIQVIDFSGRTLHSESSINTENHQVDVSNFPSGPYIIRISTDRGISTEKFFKAK